MANFWIVAQQVGVLFVLIGLGAFCRWRRLVDEFAIRGLVNILVLLVTPALIVDVFQRPFDAAMLGQFALAAALAVGMHLALILLARLTVRNRDARAAPVLRLATVFSNAGFMGIPLEQAILGADGVFFGIVYVAVFNLFMWSWGLGEMKSEKYKVKSESGKSTTFHFSLFTFHSLVNPGTVGIVLGLPLFFFSLRLPEVLHAPVHMLANLNTPFAMLVIGYYLAGADLKGLARSPSAHAAALMRLVVSPVLLILVLWPFRAALDRTMMLALVTAASAPVAAMVTMFASKYQRDVDLSVGLVSGTTLLSAVTMPAVLAVAMAVL